VALLCLLAISGLRSSDQRPVDRYSVAFDLCAIAYLVESAPGLRDSHAWWIAPARLLSISTPAVFLLWAQAAFTDSFVPRWWRWLPFGCMLALGLWAITSDFWLAWRSCQAAALLLAAGGIYQALAGRASDLVEARRRSRLVFACGLGFCIVVTTLLGAARVSAVPAVSIVLGFVLTAALLRLRFDRAVDPPAATVHAAPSVAVVVPPAPVASAEERALHQRLRTAMEQERIYREGGLTVATLADRLGVPEYRLRRLINQRLGHRNFVSFVNSYRLAEAMSALADGDQARVPVLTIALDAGFQSIGPFNRAFKGHTGETPTEFRTRSLSPEGATAAD
jgi:AraC-like DNA-binding protein